MRTIALIAVMVATLGACAAPDDIPGPFPAAPVPDDALVGMFEGKFPCDTCNKIKTALLLLHDPATRAPTTYFQRQIGVGRGNSADDTHGTWSLHKGRAADPDADVIELTPDAAQPLIHYLKVDDNILLLLDDTLTPRVGNATYSFTLSRTR